MFQRLGSLTGPQSGPRFLNREVVPSIERIFCADRRLTDRVTKRIGKGVQRPPTCAVTGDDVIDSKRPQPVHCLGDDPFHDTAQVKPTHYAIDRNARKEIAGMNAPVDNASVGAGAEDDQSQITDVRNQHALVHQQRIGLPGAVGARSTQMIDAAFFEGRHARNFTAQVEMIIEQQSFITAIDHVRPALL